LELQSIENYDNGPPQTKLAACQTAPKKVQNMFASGSKLKHQTLFEKPLLFVESSLQTHVADHGHYFKTVSMDTFINEIQALRNGSCGNPVEPSE